MSRDYSIEKVYKSAEKLVQQGNLAAAIDAYKKIADENPGKFMITNTMGDLCVRVGRSNEAIRHFQLVAEYFSESGFTLKAIAMYKKINKLAPDKPEFYLKLAELYTVQGLLSDARQWYLTLLEVYRKSGEMRNAADIYERMAKLRPEDPIAWINLANCYKDLGLNNGAQEAYLKAGRAFVNDRCYDEAIQSYNMALQAKPESKIALKLLVDRLVHQDRLGDAIALLNKMIAENPLDIDLLVILGLVYLDANMLIEAGRTYCRLFELDNTRCGYLLEVVRRYVDQEEFDQAVAIIDQCVDKLVTYKLAEKTLTLIKSALIKDPKNLLVLKCLTSIYRHEKDTFFLTITLNCIVDLALELELKDEANLALRELVNIDPTEIANARRLAQLNGEPLIDWPESSLIQHQEFEKKGNSVEVKDKELNKLNIDLIKDEQYSDKSKIETTFFAQGSTRKHEIDLSKLDLMCQKEILLETVMSEQADRYCSNDGSSIFDIVLKREWLRAMRSNFPISLGLVKATFMEGHREPEQILSWAINLVQAELGRPGDFVALYGDKIAVLLSGAHMEGAVYKVEDLCTKIGEIFYRAGLHIKLNWGIASAIPQRYSLSKILLDSAGKALNEAIASESVLGVSNDFHVNFQPEV
jgi:tetratricopeptide (TPR) repeat protein